MSLYIYTPKLECPKALPILGFVLSRSPLYDNFRQVLFVLPPLFLLAGLGFDRISHRGLRTAAIASATTNNRAELRTTAERGAATVALQKVATPGKSTCPDVAALLGLPLSQTRANLEAMADAAQAAGAKVLLVGMQVPPNYGSAYARDFENVFGDVARQAKAGLVPFLLKGVADRADAMEWFQPDRIHPLAKAHPQMLDNVWPALKPLL